MVTITWCSVHLASARTQVASVRNFAVGDPKGPPRALQASECHELLNPTRTSCLILAQRQPGKLFELCTNLLFDGLTYFTDLVQINYPRIWWTLWHRITLHYIGIKHLHVGPKPYKKLQEWPWGHLDGNWSSFQLAKSTPPQSVIDRAIAPSARMFVVALVSFMLQNFRLLLPCSWNRNDVSIHTNIIITCTTEYYDSPLS